MLKDPRKLAAPLVELRLHYCFCHVVGAAASLACALIVANAFHGLGCVGATGVAASVCAVGLVAALASWRRRRGAEIRRERAAARAERPRLAQRLQPLRARLRRLCADDSASILVAPGSAVLAWTERSVRAPRVILTTGFWVKYGGTPLMEACLAHEAGHIAARDVESFQRLLDGLWGIGATVAASALAVIPRLLLRERSVASFMPVLITVVAALVGLIGAWSALVVAREVQADAFAARVLGGGEPVAALLRSQAALRESSGRRGLLARLWPWLVQPQVALRASLPVLRGRLPGRVSVQLGLAMASALGLWSLVAALLASIAADVSPRFAQVLEAGVFFAAIAWIAVHAYVFFWGTNRHLGGGLDTLVESVVGWLRFSGFGGVCFALLLEAWFVFTGHPIRGPSLALAFGSMPLLSLAIWAIAKAALAFEARRGAARPHVSVAIVGFILFAVAQCVGMLLLQSQELSEWTTVSDVARAWLAAAGLLGLIAHVLAPGAKEGS